MSEETKGSKIRQMLQAGKKYKEIGETLQVAKSTIAYHARELGLVRGHPIEFRRYDWAEIQAYYDIGYCQAEVTEHFNMRPGTIRDAVKNGSLKIDRSRCCKTHRQGKVGVPHETIFIVDSVYSTKVTKQKILRENLIPYSCSNEFCDLYQSVKPVWAGKLLVLHLDHINGIRNDHRLENLRFLCPNCHTQTSTYCGRNKKDGASGEI